MTKSTAAWYIVVMLFFGSFKMTSTAHAQMNCPGSAMEQRRAVFAASGARLLDQEINLQFARVGSADARKKYIDSVTKLVVSVLDLKKIDPKMSTSDFIKDAASGVTTLAGVPEKSQWMQELLDTIRAASEVALKKDPSAAASFLTEKTMNIISSTDALININDATGRASVIGAARDVLSAYYSKCGDRTTVLRQLGIDAKTCPANGSEHWLLCATNSYATRIRVNATQTRARVELFLRSVAKYVAVGTAM